MSYYTQDQLLNAADGKDAREGGLNKPEIVAYLKKQGLRTNKLSSKDLRKRLKEHLGAPMFGAFRDPIV
jgi:hypothetical protein